MILERILFSPFASYPWLSAIVVVVLFVVMWRVTTQTYLKYIRYLYLINKNNWTMLELIVPAEIKRSPEAMDIFLNNGFFWKKGDSTSLNRKWIKGETQLVFSLEIASFGGNVKFFARVPTRLVDMVRSQLYAQFPQVEIRETDDYTDRIPQKLRDEIGMAMFSWEYKLAKPDAYPIKTYRDWGLDRKIESLDPEQQVDPLVSMIEKLANVDPWEEMWVQFVVRATGDSEWRAEGEKLIDEIIVGNRRAVPSEEPKTPMLGTLTKGEQQVVDAIERNIDQNAYYVGIRSMYITRRSDNFKVPAVGYLGDLFTSFNSESLNSIKSTNPSGYDNPWDDYKGKLEYWRKDRALEMYRRRWFFPDQPMRYTPLDFFYNITGFYKRTVMILTTEELATIFHFPGGFTQSPSVERTDVKKARPPANLPIG